MPGTKRETPMASKHVRSQERGDVSKRIAFAGPPKSPEKMALPLLKGLLWGLKAAAARAQTGKGPA